MTINRTRALTLLVLFTIQIGCASSYIDAAGRLHFAPPEKLLKNLDNKPSCCRHFWEFTYTNIELDESYLFQINNKFPTFNFDTGKSYVLALEIPTYYKSFKLEIDSYFDDNLFYPNIAILDDHYYVIKSVSYKSIKHENIKKFSSAYLSGSFDINETKDTAKYLLIYTTDELLKYRIMTNPGSRHGYDLHASPEGKIRITLNTD